MKEYFKILEFYTLIGKNTDALRNLEINEKGEEKILVEKKKINKIITKKYKKQLNDEGHKIKYIHSASDEVIKLRWE